MMLGTGTLINTAAVVAGSLMGLLIHSKLPPRIIAITFQGIGLFTVFIGFFMAQRTQNPLVMILSIVLGAIVGEGIDLAKYLERFSAFLKTKVHSSNERFSEGLITAFLLFCMGSMTIMGAIEEGMGQPPKLFFAKSVLDGFSSIALSTTFGVGVLCSALPLLIYQGALTLLFAGVLHNLPDAIIGEISAVGGLLLIGLGLTILEIKPIKILNMLPALLFAAIFAYLLL